MAQIAQNEFNYLTNLSKGNDGNAAWAKSQLQGATVAPAQNATGTTYQPPAAPKTVAPAPTGSAPTTQTGQGTYSSGGNITKAANGMYNGSYTMSPSEFASFKSIGDPVAQNNYLQGLYAKAYQAQGSANSNAPTTTGSQYNVNDPSFQNLSSDQRLAAFKSDPALAQQEIARDKQMYMNVMNAKAGDPILNGMSVQDRLNQIHSWADNVRSSANIDANDAVYGNGDNSPALVQQDNGQQPDTTPQQDATNNAAANNNDMLGNSIQGMIQDALNPRSPYWNGLQSQASNSAAQIVHDKQMQLDNARQGLDDQYFQQYLKAREAMAGRGLANSGLANESDFRLSLAKQADLGKVYAQLGTFNPSQIQSDEFSKLYSDASKNMLSGADTLAGLYKANLPYTAPTADAVLQNNFNYDKLSTDSQNAQAKMAQDKQIAMAQVGVEYAKLDEQHKQFYDKLNQDGAIEAAKMQLSLKQYNLDVAKVMGADANGNPTLDAKKLMAQVANDRANIAEKTRHDLVSESTSAFNAQTSRANLGLRAQEIQNTANANSQRMSIQLAQLQNDQLKEQGGALLDNAKLAQGKLSSLVSQADSYRSNNQAVPQDLQDSIDNAAKQIDDNGLAMEMLYKVDSASRPVSAPPTSGMGYDPTE